MRETWIGDFQVDPSLPERGGNNRENIVLNCWRLFLAFLFSYNKDILQLKNGEESPREVKKEKPSWW